MKGTTDIVKRARAATLVEREEFLFIKSSGAVAGCPTAQRQHLLFMTRDPLGEEEEEEEEEEEQQQQQQLNNSRVI